MIWVDLGSIQGDGFIRSAWFRYNHPSRRPDGRARTLMLFSFRCQDRMSGATSLVDYDAAGAVIKTLSHHDPVWSPVVPDSVGEAQFNFVCTYPIGLDWRQIDGMEIEQ